MKTRKLIFGLAVFLLIIVVIGYLIRPNNPGPELQALQNVVAQLQLPEPYQKTIVDKNCASGVYKPSATNCLRNITLLYHSTSSFTTIQKTLVQQGWQEDRAPTAALNHNVQTYAFSKNAIEGHKTCVQGYINYAANAPIALEVGILAPSDKGCL
jgi:hypothetical protein